MSYNSARDELFFAGYEKVVGDLHDVYRPPHDMTPHERLGHCSCVCGKWGRAPTGWWHWAATGANGTRRSVKTDGEGIVCCALSDSRVLLEEAQNLAHRIIIWSCSALRAARTLRAFTAFTCPNSTCNSPRRVTLRHSSRCYTERTSRCAWIDCTATDSRNSLASRWRLRNISWGSLIDSSSASITKNPPLTERHATRKPSPIYWSQRANFSVELVCSRRRDRSRSSPLKEILRYSIV